MYVKVNGVISEKTNIKIGTPQGSILGPLLFTIFINDMTLHLGDCDNIWTILFAYDTTLFCAENIFVKLRESLCNSELILLEWFKANKLSINLSKTKFLLFNLHRYQIDCNEVDLPLNLVIECEIILNF